MANTLKFGTDGNWATKKGSTLAYNDEGGNFKPLPFTTTRNSIATRVNKEGLIEVVSNDVPRIDYTDSADGVLLLEPSRTNKATYSEDFSQSFWTKSNANVVSGFASPDGNNNAYKLVEDATNSSHFIRSGFIGTTDGGSIIPSIFVKSAERSQVVLQEDAYTGQFMTVDLIAETISTNGQNANLTKLANGWFRIDFKSLGKPSTRWKISPSVNLSSTYQGDGTSGIYIFGFQLEDNVSYATSYIPTNGSAITRQADTASGAGNSQVFNDSEGVLFADISALANDSTNRIISLSDGSGSNRILVKYDNSSNTIEGACTVGTDQARLTYNGNIKLNSKVCFKYKQNDFSLFVNGFKVDTDTNGNTPSGLDTLNFDNGSGGSDFYGKTKELGYYDEILTDLELETLTSYRSLNELVTELNLNTL